MKTQRTYPAKIYDIDLSANESRPLPFGGSYFKILSAQGDLYVEGDGFGTLGVLKAGQGLRDIPFAHLLLTDRSGSRNQVQLLVADTNFVDDRIAGEVSVIDGARGRTMAGDEFSGRIPVPALAANFNAVQWYNPAISGVNMEVAELWGIASAGLVEYGTINAVQYANLYAPLAFNKLPGSGGSVVEQRWQQLGTFGATKGGGTAQEHGTLLSGVIYKPTTPLIIKPGRALYIASADVNVTLTACAAFREARI